MLIPIEKFTLEVMEYIPTQPIEVIIESIGIAPAVPVFFQADDAYWPSEEQLWQQKQEEHNIVPTE